MLCKIKYYCSRIIYVILNPGKGQTQRKGQDNMKKYRRLSFQVKLLGIFLGITCLFGAIYAAYYNISRTMIRKNMIAYSEIYVDSISSSITNMIQEIDRLSMTFLLQNDMIRDLGKGIPKELPEYGDYYRRIRYSIEQMLNIRIDMEGILIVDSFGRVIAGGPNASYSDGANISKEKWYQEFLESEKMFQIMPLRKTNAMEVFSIARKLRSYEEMKVNGIVCIDMKKRLLDEICNKTRLNQNSVLLFDRDKALFYVSGEKPDEREITEITKKLSPENGNFQVLGGRKALNISLNYSEYLDMYIVYVVPQNVLMSGLNDLNRIAVLLLFLGGSAGIGLAVGASRVMSRGVGKVMQGMQAIEAGNLDVEIEVESNDEIRTIAGGLNHMVKRIKILMEEKSQIEVKRKEAEMMMLQRQIRPHFLYNTLDGIRMKALLNQDHEAAEMIEKLSVLLRRTTDLKTEEVTVREELEYVNSYIDLQNLRFRYKFQLITDIPEEVSQLVIPKFSLQPLIENAVHHGLEKRKIDRQIRISSELTEEAVRIMVYDNGQGISLERLQEIRKTLEDPQMQESEHIGLNNINIRLKLHYGKEYGLTIDSEENAGTKLTLHLPRQSSGRIGGNDV